MKKLADRMLNRKQLVVLGAVLYLFLLLITAPVGIMERLLPHYSGERLYLQSAHGSFWRGEAADLVVASTDGNTQSLGAIKWRMLWLPILRGELAIALDLATAPKESHGIVALVPGGIRLRKIDVAMPISTLTEFYPNWKLWQPGGMLEAHAEMFGVSRDGVNGVAEVKWQNASSSLSRINPFGSYLLSVKEGKLNLSALSGPLQLSGQGEWSGRGVKFEGMAQAEPPTRDNLQDFMRLFGKEEGSGTYRVSMSLAR